MIKCNDKNSYWYTTKHELIKYNPIILHSIEVLKIYDKLGIVYCEIKEWIENEKTLDDSVRKDVLNMDFEKVYEKLNLENEQTGSEHMARGLKLLSLKKGNITIRTIYLNVSKTFKIIINYYGEKGLKLLKDFTLDNHDFFENMEVATLDVKTETFYKFKDVKELIESF